MPLPLKENVYTARRQEIHCEFVKVQSRGENYKIQFDSLMNNLHEGKYKIKITIVASDMQTNARKKFLEAYMNALDLATVVDMIMRKEFKSEKFYGGGVEDGQVICRITEFVLKEDGSLTVSIQKCPGKKNDDGGYSPIGKPLDSIAIYLRGFPLQRTLYRLKLYIEHKFLIDFKKHEFAPVKNQNLF